MHKTKNSEILANIDFTKISEKKIMPQTGIELLRTLKNCIERGSVPPLLTVVQDLYNFFVQVENKQELVNE